MLLWDVVVDTRFETRAESAERLVPEAYRVLTHHVLCVWYWYSRAPPEKFLKAVCEFVSLMGLATQFDLRHEWGKINCVLTCKGCHFIGVGTETGAGYCVNGERVNSFEQNDCKMESGNDTVYINLLKTKRNLLYIRNQSVPRSKRFPPRL